MTISNVLTRALNGVLLLIVSSQFAPVTLAQKLSEFELMSAVTKTVNAKSVAGSVPFAPSTDGWHRWEVAAVKGVPQRCCSTWRDGQLEGGSCSIDPHANSYTKTDNRSYDKTGDNDSMQLFARLEDGEVQSIQVFGERCKVTSRQAVTDYQRVDAAQSLRWLETQLAMNRKVLGAIAIHNLARAQQVLVEAARNGKEATRKDAIFWMGQVRAQASRDELIRLVTRDSSNKIREHTVFSLSQSDLADRLDLIERVAINDRASKVRGQAWFWMAQTGTAGTESRIRRGMERESSTQVLEQAVFALSQLKQEDSVEALIRVVEDQQQHRAVRKKALFWLGQDGSEPALEYLSDVLSR